MNARSAAAFLTAALLAAGCGKVSDGTGGTVGSGGPSNAGGAASRGDGTAAKGDGAAGGSDGAVGSDSGGSSIPFDGGESACPGTQVRIDGECLALGTVTPCGRLPSSGFPGDSQCIEAPTPALGMQLHYGPRDYTDPEEVAKFVLPPGKADSSCMFMRSPNADRVHVKEWHARVRPGAYEALLFENTIPQPDSTGPDSCAGSGPAGGALVSVAGTDLDLSLDGGAPEYAGAGMTTPAHAELAFNVNMGHQTWPL